MIALRILAIIPARGGSKGIPRKNLANLCGRPLIAWSIATANALLEQGVVAEAIVSTDDAEIAEVSRAHGAKVPFLRPAELANDTAKAIAYVTHALDFMTAKGQDFDAVMILQPTAPVRDPAAIASAVTRFADGSSNSLISCYQEDYINDVVSYEHDGSGYLKPRRSDHNAGVRRQEHGPVMVRNGALYVTRTSYIRETGSLVCERPTLMAMRRIDSFNIDTPDDLEILRALLCR
jgi:CMP-N,N'-diacetyllegionaminic acid synthase